MLYLELGTSIRHMPLIGRVTVMTVLSTSSIEWAINCLVNHQDTDLLPKIFEYEAINSQKEEVIKFLSKQDICQWQSRPFRRCLVPKSRFGFRLATQLDPLDMIFYLGLMLEVGEQIEKSRIPADRNISFSYRFAPDNTDYTFFNRSIGYREFEQYCADLTEQYEYVVMADIADFYQRIYLHRLENALSLAVKPLPTHVKSIIQLIKGWNQNVSYGIPVGSNPSRLLADLVIDDIDRTLLSEGIIFARFVDDYRIFCRSKQEAYQCMARLATILFETNGLTLQSQKTRILTCAQFYSEFIEPEQRKELQALDENFYEIMSAVGIENWYGPIELEVLPDSIQEKIDALNLESLLEFQLDSDDIDVPLTKFIINRLIQLQKPVHLRKLLTETEKIYPILPEVIRYLNTISHLIPPTSRNNIGKHMIDSIESSVLGQLEFHRMQILSLFAENNVWGSEDKLPMIYHSKTDTWSRRTLIQAIGKSAQHYWLRTKKSEIEQLPIWERRAYIYAASCFPKDERDNYYRAVSSRLDILDKYVLAWAQKNPIDT